MSKPFVPIELDKPRRLRFDANALVALEETLGKSLQQIFSEQSTFEAVGFKEMRAVLWAGLLADDPNLTLRQAGELFDLERMAEIIKKIVEAISLAFPAARREQEKNGEAPVVATGAGENT